MNREKGGDPISISQKFRDASGNYTVEIEDSQVKLECYLLGSPTGGTGTECFHTIGAGKIPEFLSALGIATTTEIPEVLALFGSREWSSFHQLVMKVQTESFVWHETNWDD